MAKLREKYHFIIVESYKPKSTAGLHGPVHIRPIAGEMFPQSLQVECSKKLSRDYPPGTRFKLKVKLTDKDGTGDYLYSHFKWKVEVISKPTKST